MRQQFIREMQGVMEKLQQTHLLNNIVACNKRERIAPILKSFVYE